MTTPRMTPTAMPAFAPVFSPPAPGAGVPEFVPPWLPPAPPEVSVPPDAPVRVAEVLLLLRVVEGCVLVPEDSVDVWDAAVDDDVDEGAGVGSVDEEALESDDTAASALLLPHVVVRHCCCAVRSPGAAAMQSLCHFWHMREGTVFAYSLRFGSKPELHLHV